MLRLQPSFGGSVEASHPHVKDQYDNDSPTRSGEQDREEPSGRSPNRIEPRHR